MPLAKPNRNAWTTTASLLIALLALAGTALATEVSQNGESSSDGDTANFTQDPNGPCHQYNNNDRFTFNDLHVAKNLAGKYVPQLDEAFTVDLYEWVGGARGPILDSKSETLHAPVGQVAQNMQSVTGVYNGWNGPNSCWTFEVHRTITNLNNGNFWWDDVVY